MKKLLIGIVLFFCATQTYSQFVPKSLTAANGTFIGFYDFRPADYNVNTSKKFPLIIFLHGIGERGNGTTELSMLTYHAIPRLLASGATMQFTNPSTGQKE